MMSENFRIILNGLFVGSLMGVPLGLVNYYHHKIQAEIARNVTSSKLEAEDERIPTNRDLFRAMKADGCQFGPDMLQFLNKAYGVPK